MKTFPLGTTDIQASKLCLGGLPIQRVSEADAVAIVRRAVDAGINLYDTARAYSDSEAKLGTALLGVRQNVYLATKVSGANTGAEATAMIETSLRHLQTDYIDIIQFHFAKDVPAPGDENGLYDALQNAVSAGKARFIGLTTHRLDIALKAAKSGLYSTVQFPLSYLSSPEELELMGVCRAAGVGLLGMKGLCGGLLNNGAAVHAFFDQYEADCRPLIGIQHMHELEEFLSYCKNPPRYADVAGDIERDRAELCGVFCRGCGYCMPCPQGIELSMAMRIELLLKRAVVADYMDEDTRAKMQQTRACTGCGLCMTRCPYHMNPPNMLPTQYDAYMRAYDAYWREYA
ncbi:aldo/keto reductase [Christensenellaceae bacterium OttesenSCG-928-L17]|nr:aldo/keto reductase [Christensenellaceae bacterium OttesenSCG-928-L17]